MTLAPAVPRAAGSVSGTRYAAATFQDRDAFAVKPLEAFLDAITLLREDHKLLRKLSKELADTTEAAVETRKKLLKRLEIELNAHTTIEEELFYPAILDASTDVEDARMVAEGVEEVVAETASGLRSVPAVAASASSRGAGPPLSWITPWMPCS
mgnify:CR=1 FL=1